MLLGHKLSSSHSEVSLFPLSSDLTQSLWQTEPLAAHTRFLLSHASATISKDYVFLSPSGTVSAPLPILQGQVLRKILKESNYCMKHFWGEISCPSLTEVPRMHCRGCAHRRPGPLRGCGDRDPDACEVESRRGPQASKRQK